MDMIAEIKGELRRRLDAALEAAVAAGELPALPPGEIPGYAIEAPRERDHGDLAANLALVLSGRLKRPPRQVAEVVIARFPGDGSPVERLEVAGPGFINIFLRPGWLVETIRRMLDLGAAYGRGEAGRGRRVLVEFVSANPTGPLNVVNARAAAYGDALANVLAATGCAVEREYYVNDAGAQAAMLGLAMEIRCRQALGQDVELPEGAYPGLYVVDLAREYLDGAGGDEAGRVLAAARPSDPPARRAAPGENDEEEGPLPGAGAGDGTDPPALAALRRALAAFAVDRLVAEQQASLRRYGVEYDRWVREASVRDAGGPEGALTRLRAGGHVYEKDGAVWFRSTDFGDDRDRVLVRRDGRFTYFLVDIAYHLDKFRRGYDLAIDIWGQDHHGYVPRIRAALRALGCDPARLEVLLNQVVRLVRGGEVVRMSKRRGEFVTMDELIDDVGPDAARFLFLMRSLESHMDFDLDLARLQAAENPVYYVQYAHARICSILRQAAEPTPAQATPPTTPALAAPSPPSPPPAPPPPDLARLGEPAELDLIRKLAEFPGEVTAAAESREPHRLTGYCRELATFFHTFYVQCRVLGPDPELTAARLALVAATRQVLANALALLGVSAPERM